MGAGSGAAVASCVTAVSAGPQMLEVASTSAPVLKVRAVATGSSADPTIWDMSEVGTLNCSSALTNSASLMLVLGVAGVVVTPVGAAPASIAGTRDGPSLTTGSESDATTIGSPIGAVVSTLVDAAIAVGD